MRKTIELTYKHADLDKAAKILSSLAMNAHTLVNVDNRWNVWLNPEQIEEIEVTIKITGDLTILDSPWSARKELGK